MGFYFDNHYSVCLCLVGRVCAVCDAGRNVASSEGERMDAVGQWGPFVGTAFVVMAAVVVRYGDEMSCRWREVK